MTTQLDALRKALEALEYHQEQTRPISKTQEAIAAVREVLAAQPEQPDRELTDEQITAGAAILCDCPKPKPIGRNAAIDVFHAMADASPQVRAEQTAKVPKGWKLVPIEPVDQQIAAVQGVAPYPRAAALIISDYRDMIATAPQPPQESKT
jgi:hypothetical protein